MGNEGKKGSPGPDDVTRSANDGVTIEDRSVAAPRAPAEPGPEGHLPDELPDLGDKFVVLGFIGAGGMGTVYRVRHRKLDHQRAVKILPQSASALAVERLRREASIQTELAHPNIVAVYDLEDLPDGRIAIVMESLEGQDLGEYLEHHGSMAPDQVQESFAGVADALDRMHQAGVIHRDLKPANLFVCSNGTIKVLDFGIARLLDDEVGLTRTGHSVGTPGYMSPEQLDGKAIGPHTDIYGLSAVLYYCLTGQQPITGSSRAELVAKVLLHEPPRADELAPDLPRSAGDALARGLAKDPSQRFSSATELLLGLEGRASTAPPRPTRDHQRGRRWERSGPTVALAVLVVALIALVVFWHENRSPAPDVAGAPATEGSATDGTSPLTGGTLRLAHNAELASLDPLVATSVRFRTMHYLLYDTLVDLDWTGEVVPLLAETWVVQDDYQRFTFRLRDDVVFHADPCFPDEASRALDAEDVRRSLQRFFLWVASDPHSSWGTLPRVAGTDEVLEQRAEALSGLRALDDRTLEVTFTQPAPSFLHNLSWPELSIHAAEAIDRYEQDGDLGFHGVGTVPYRFVENVPGRGMTLERHPDAWQRSSSGARLPYPERIEVRLFRGNLPAMTALREGKVDLIPAVPRDVMNDAMELRGQRAVPREGWERYQAGGYLDEVHRIQQVLLVDQGTDHPVATEVGIRRAISRAIRRQDLVDSWTAAADSPLSEGMLGYEPGRSHDGDADAARGLLEDAGYRGSAGLPPLSLCGVAGEQESLTAIGTHLMAAGIQADVAVLEHETWAAYMEEGGCDLLMAHYFGTVVDDDPSDHLISMSMQVRLEERRPDAEATIRAIRQTGNSSQRVELARSLAEMLVEDSMIIVLSQRRPGEPVFGYLAGPRVGGLTDPNTGLMNPVRQRLRELWVEPEEP